MNESNANLIFFIIDFIYSMYGNFRYLFFMRSRAHIKYNLSFKSIVQQICSLICNDIYQIYDESTINTKPLILI